MSKDVGRHTVAQLDWGHGQRAASLAAVFQHTIGLAVEAEDWYARKRRPKRTAGRGLRVTAIVLGAIAAVLPVLSEITAKHSKPTIAPGWASVALALAAALITLDHFFGFSSGWMRFTNAELQLTRLRHQFEYAWSAQRATSRAAPSDAEVTAYLTLARDLVLAVDQIIADETADWIKEFRGGLDRTEASLRTTKP